MVSACQTVRFGGSGFGYVGQALREAGFSVSNALLVERWMRQEIDFIEP